ncbi:hypothetical protein [Lysinibacter cavernae]|uniref:Phage tail protein n=1 Tax=Lysinibacter cavernae TaxID=1640652 RepID=A0A7X5TTC9_9MICO|nr:hypothetical protein [Lysinibacter cavernae]NIH52552.1 hypothetical protein [Lysinibacter cavernae]
MRVTLASARGVLDLVDGPHENRAPGPGLWGLEKDGLSGWYEPAAPRASSELIPQQHGSYWPAQLLLSPRILTIRGFRQDKSSAVAESIARDYLAALIVHDLTVHVQDAAGIRTVTGYQGSVPVFRHLNNHKSGFSLILTCPDPMKYGREATFSAVGGVITAENAGTAPSYPVFEVSGRVTSLTITQGFRTIRWAGDAVGLRIDTRSGTATSNGVEVGGLIDDVVTALPPGRHALTVSATAGAQVSMKVRPAWY